MQIQSLGAFEVHLDLNECDRTWNDPCTKSPSTVMKGVERDNRRQCMESCKRGHAVCLSAFTKGYAEVLRHNAAQNNTFGPVPVGRDLSDVFFAG